MDDDSPAMAVFLSKSSPGSLKYTQTPAKDCDLMDQGALFLDFILFFAHSFK